MIVVQLLQWCVSCVGSQHAIAPGLGVLGGAAGAAGAVGALGNLLADGEADVNPPPAPVDLTNGEGDPSAPADQLAPVPPVPAAGTPADLGPPTMSADGAKVTSGPEGSTISTSADGQTTITLPDGTVIQATSTGGTGFAAQLPDGNLLAQDAQGGTTLQLPDGSTQSWDAQGHYTGTAAPDLGSGASLNAPPVLHDVVVPTSDGGYRIDHPDGSSDIHYATGDIVHVEPDGLHWHQTEGPAIPPSP